MSRVTSRSMWKAKTVALVANAAAAAAGSAPRASGEAIDVRGRFRLERALAQGGMGVIYQARDCRLNRDVALKVLSAAHAGNRALERRLLDEAHLTASLEHPGVVPVLEIGRCVDRRPFFAMGLVEGETLAQILARRRLVGKGDGLADLLRPFEQACQAVGHAHARGVIHRDLKPENVMIGGFGAVKVIDWGIAAALAQMVEGDAELEVLFGTPAYLPPEQARGELGRIDERADVFSLGGILCEMLTGAPPFAGAEQEDVLRRARAGDVSEAWERLQRCGADHELVKLAKRCLEPRAEDRPRDAGAVGRVIKDYLESGLRRLQRDQVRFFDRSLEMFCIAGLDGFFRQINANFPRTLGFSEAELLGRPFLDFVHPEDVAPTLEAMARLRAGEKVTGFVNRYQHVAGHYVRLEWSSRAVPEEGVIYAVARPLP